MNLDVAALREADAACDAARFAMNKLRAERSDLLESMCIELTQRSDRLIRASLKRGTNLEVVTATLRDMLKGTGTKGTKIEELADFVSGAADPVAAHAALLDDLEKLAIMRDTDGFDTEAPSTPFLTSAGFSKPDIQRLARGLTQADWLRLSLTIPGDVPAFEYRAKENEYILFSNASAGQQATALLTMLLNTEDPPLVIDQPEEDLDDNVIQQIVQLIWGAKSRRQIIFSSHNANLMVNGDADLVVCCAYRTAGDQSGGKILAEGAIDVQVVRNAITEVMEGGEAAFRLRREKYGF